MKDRIHPGVQPGLTALRAFPSKSLKQLIDVAFRLYRPERVAHEAVEGCAPQGVTR